MTKDNEEIKHFQARLQACLIECINNQNISKAEICRRKKRRAFQNLHDAFFDEF